MHQAKSPIESAVEEAKKTCEEGTTGECAAAWDSVSKEDGGAGSACDDLKRSCR